MKKQLNKAFQPQFQGNVSPIVSDIDYRGFDKILDSVRFLMDLEPSIRMEKINKAI